MVEMGDFVLLASDVYYTTNCIMNDKYTRLPVPSSLGILGKPIVCFPRFGRRRDVDDCRFTLGIW
jgi:hypothetical protein